MAVFECWMVILTIFGIAVAGLTGRAIYWQARIGAATLEEIRKSGTDTHSLAMAANIQAGNTSKQVERLREQVEQLTRSASATRDLATSVQQGMQVSTRAYLAMSQIKIYCPICEPGATISPPETANDNNASINIFFTNSGHSPATVFDQNTALRSTNEPRDDKNFAFPEFPDILPQPKYVVVQPSIQFPLQIIRGTRGEFILDARGKFGNTTPLYIYGHISYTDAFRKPHTLLYCAEYHKPTNVSPENWSACPRHNEEYDGKYVPGK